MSSTRRARPTLVAATVSRLAPSHSPMRSKPWPSSPSRLAAGTRQPSKTSSLWWYPRCDTLRGPGTTVSPGVSRSTRKPVIRLTFRPRTSSVPLAANRITKSDLSAWLMKCFVPSIT